MSSGERLQALRDAAAALGPWFHNIDLGGVMTAPDHFLGDYPAVKWQRFAHAIPTDLRGRTV
ncbi:MAG: TIGR04290 family methyltransferase, partial [Alphaproteobacteria bacterium]|nr:TIGR04290 family methyltransferase [Alphaproteobacteria bacterium]